MEVRGLRGHGVAFSDAESRRPRELQEDVRRRGRAIVWGHLGSWEKVRFAAAFLLARRRARPAATTW